MGWWADVLLWLASWQAWRRGCWSGCRAGPSAPPARSTPACCCLPLRLQELVAAFAAEDLQHAAELTTQLRYICRIREAIADKL